MLFLTIMTRKCQVGWRPDRHPQVPDDALPTDWCKKKMTSGCGTMGYFRMGVKTTTFMSREKWREVPGKSCSTATFGSLPGWRSPRCLTTHWGSEVQESGVELLWSLCSSWTNKPTNIWKINPKLACPPTVEEERERPRCGSVDTRAIKSGGSFGQWRFGEKVSKVDSNDIIAVEIYIYTLYQIQGF